MAVKLRLARVGGHKRPYFWVVAADLHKPRDGRYIEKLGTFDPRADRGEVELKTDRINYWLDQGAKPSDAVRELLRKKGILKLRAGGSDEPVEETKSAPEENGSSAEA